MATERKKALKDRWHECHSCRIKAQRDLYSAYLACFVQDNELDTSQAQAAWTGVGILLEGLLQIILDGRFSLLLPVKSNQ